MWKEMGKALCQKSEELIVGKPGGFRDPLCKWFGKWKMYEEYMHNCHVCTNYWRPSLVVFN